MKGNQMNPSFYLILLGSTEMELFKSKAKPFLGSWIYPDVTGNRSFYPITRGLQVKWKNFQAYVSLKSSLSRQYLTKLMSQLLLSFEWLIPLLNIGLSGSEPNRSMESTRWP